MIASNPPDCPSGTFCHWVYSVTNQSWLADSSDWLVIKPLRIIGIVLGALIVRWLCIRLIQRLTSGAMPSLLKPLRQKAPTALLESGLLSERRRQRAGTIGSLLRSAIGAAIFAIVLLMVLQEFNLDVAPLLASVSIVGIALGFGAQALVKDILSGIFMLLEDQYGVGDSVDLGEASGTVEAVGLRVTTIRDARGVVWYVRNGEIARVGNKSQGWAAVVIDVPIGHGNLDKALEIIQTTVLAYATSPEHADQFLEPPSILGVEQLTIDGAVLRITAQTSSEAQGQIGRELRGRITTALESAQIFPRTPPDLSTAEPTEDK